MTLKARIAKLEKLLKVETRRYFIRDTKATYEATPGGLKPTPDTAVITDRDRVVKVGIDISKV